MANDFVQRLRLQQLRLKVDLRNDPAMKSYVDEKRIKINSQRLEVLDRLSLYFCAGAEENTTIEAVPLDDEGNEVDCAVRAVGPKQVSIDPYPFRRDPLEIAILARRVPKRRYADDIDFQAELASASFFNIGYAVRSHGVANSSLAAGR